MAGYGLTVQGSGATPPLRQYAAAVLEGFSRVSRLRAIESSIALRNKLDILRVNLKGNNNALTDNYIQFRIPGVTDSS